MGPSASFPHSEQTSMRAILASLTAALLLRRSAAAPTIPEARAKVDENAARGADIIKVWIDAQGGRHPKLTREYVGAVLEQARKNNLLTGAHVVELDDAKMVVDLGINVLLHNVRDKEV